MDTVHFDAAVLGTGSIYCSGRTGVHRYVLELLLGLVRSGMVDLELVSFGRGRWLDQASRQAASESLPAGNHRYRSWGGLSEASAPLFDGLRRLRSRGTLSETAFAGALQLLGSVTNLTPPPISKGLYHSPAHPLPTLPRGVQRLLTIHDMIPVMHPQWCRGAELFHQTLASIRPEQDHILCVSESTRQDLLNTIAIAPERVHVTRLATSSRFAPVQKELRISVLAKHRIRPPYLLSVATLEPRKNLDGLVRAFAALAREPGQGELQLVLIGAKGWMIEALETQLASLGPLRKRVIFPGFVADEELPAIYSGCEAFVFPSLYEGFGLPPLEAMACGAPVVCLANSSLPEVVGGAIPLVQGTGTESLAQGILDAIALPRDAFGHAPSREQAAKFSWDRTATETIHVYGQASAVR